MSHSDDVEAWRLAQEAASTLRALAIDASARDSLLTFRLLELADDIQETYQDVGQSQEVKS